MKILVFSDSHSNSSKIKQAIELHKAKCDCVIFLGDGLKDIDFIKEQYPQIAFFTVKGNCDLFAGDTQEERLLYLDSFKILITHGHKYGVKYGYESVLNYATQNEVDAVFFGHTHVPYDTIEYLGDKKIQDS